jgi:hypothetical protein
MSRELLESLGDNYRGWFAGIFEGVAGLGGPLDNTLLNVPKNPICLVSQICLLEDLGETTDHLWFSWKGSFEIFAPKSGDRLCFMATIKRYQRKNQSWDYGLKRLCWLQTFSLNPQKLPPVIPRSKEEAQKLLNSQSKLHRTNPERYSLDQCQEWGVRLRKWDDDLAKCLEDLILEGWGEPNPTPEEYWIQKSPALAKLDSVCSNSRDFANLATIAAIANGINMFDVFENTGIGFI